MPIICVEIMKTIDEREMQKNNKRKTNKGRKGATGTETIAKGCELNDFAVHLSFLILKIILCI